jgi:hypothetical protein
MKSPLMGANNNREVKMSKEAKKSLKKLICVGISILFITASAKATFVDASAVGEGIEYYIRIDKDVYDLEETIEMFFRLTNVGDQTLYIDDLGIYTLTLELTRPEGDTLFAPYYGPPLPPMPPGLPDIITLDEGECIEKRWYITSAHWGTNGEWVEEPFTTVGQYSITSYYNGCYYSDSVFGDDLWDEWWSITLQPDALDFIIIPEPASITLLGLGLVSLLVRKKRGAKC